MLTDGRSIGPARRPRLVKWMMVGAVALGASSAATAWGQFVPGVPPAEPRTPEYVPPPPVPPPAPTPDPGAPGADESGKAPAPRPANVQPPPAPAPEALQPVEPVSLIEKDASGQIKALAMPAELAAVKALKVDAERRARIDSLLAVRQREVERLVAEHPKTAAELWRASKHLDEIKDIGEAARVRSQLMPVLPRSSVIEMLAKAGALTGPQRAVVDQAVKEYDEQRRAQWQDKNSLADVIVLIGRDKNRQFMDEPLRAYAALLTRLGEKRSELAGAPGLSASAREALARMPQGRPTDDVSEWFAGVDEADQKALLGLVAPPPESGSGTGASTPGAPAQPPSAPAGK